MYLMPAGATVRNRKLSGNPGGGLPSNPNSFWSHVPVRPPASGPTPVPAPSGSAPPANPQPQPTVIVGGRFHWPHTAPQQPTQPVTPTPPSGPAIPGSPVPVGYPTNEIFVDSSGNQWQFNAATGQWVNIGNPTYANGPAYYYPGTPVPQGYPTNQPYVDPSGNQWIYQNGQWVNTGSQYSTTTSTIAPTGEPASVMTPAPTSSYQSILDWLTQQTLIAGVPNWILAAGVTLVAFKFSSPSGRK
jgi:hypothetical protein